MEITTTTKPSTVLLCLPVGQHFVATVVPQAVLSLRRRQQTKTGEAAELERVWHWATGSARRRKGPQVGRRHRHRLRPKRVVEVAPACLRYPQVEEGGRVV